ncbi:MAG: Lpg1974 family pore-forming outer membrane protein [Candidatus Babeliales bacterium]
MKQSFTVRALLSVLMIGYTTTLVARECNTGCGPQSVFTTSPEYRADIEFRALFFKPTGSNLYYAAEAHPLPIESPNWFVHEVKPTYHFGFDIGFHGVIHRVNASIGLNWEHFNSNDSHTFAVTDENDFVGPFFEIGPDSTLYKQAYGQKRFHFDLIDLTFGQYVQLGDRFHANLFCGIAAARIRQSNYAVYSNVDGTIIRSITAPSTFAGAGPECGACYWYDIACGVQLAGKTVPSLLMGTLKNKTTYNSISPELPLLGVPTPNTQIITVPNRNQVVPGFTQTLEFAYSYDRCNYEGRIALGYQIQLYIDAIQSVDMGSEVVTPAVPVESVGVFARTFLRTRSNFGLAGPYLAFKLGF